MVDLSSQLGPVRDQGNRGTCVAFAASSAHELARMVKRGQPHQLLSVEALYWLSKLIEGDSEPGIYVDSAKAALANPGQSDEASWEYDIDFDETTPLPGPSAGILPLPTFRASMSWIGVDPAAIQVELQTGHAVLALIDTWVDLYAYTGGDIDMPAGSDLLGEYHAVTVVGFDSAAFLVRNSWGKSWGEDGQIWLPHDAWAVAAVEAYRLRDDIDA